MFETVEMTKSLFRSHSFSVCAMMKSCKLHSAYDRVFEFSQKENKEEKKNLEPTE